MEDRGNCGEKESGCKGWHGTCTDIQLELVVAIRQKGAQMKRNDIPGKLEKERSGKNRDGSRIPFLGGRPRREGVIGSDDLTNLLIALYSSKSFEAFLNQI